MARFSFFVCLHDITVSGKVGFKFHNVSLVLDVTDFIQKKVEIDEDKERFLPLLTYVNLEC